MGFFKDLGKSITGAAGSIISGGLGLLGSSSTKKERKLLSAQEESQERLNESNAARNFQYGEQAADAAHQRSLGLLQAQTEANSYQNQVADIQAAGLNPGLLYGGAGAGGGGSAGGGAMGGGAGNQRGQAPSYLEVESVRNEKRQIALEAARIATENKLANAEAEKIKAETNNIKEETDTSKAKTPFEVELLKQQGIATWIENVRRRWEDKGGEDARSERNETDINLWHTIQKESHFNEKQALEIAEAYERVEGTKITNMLNSAKEKQIFADMINEALRVQIEQQNANSNTWNATANWENAKSERLKTWAIELATHHHTGEYTNWKTWADLVLKIAGTAGETITKAIVP